MKEKIVALKQHVRMAAINPTFVHHEWFVKWHLEVVEKLAFELLEYYPEADRAIVEVMVWLHDYGKMLDFENQYAMTLTAGRSKLIELVFSKHFIDMVITNIETLDRKLELDLRHAPIEVRIVSSADGCSHMSGPFLYIFWHERTDKTFTNKTLDQLMELTAKKINKDWRYKIVLPEARAAFEKRYELIREQSGHLPDSFFGTPAAPLQ